MKGRVAPGLVAAMVAAFMAGCGGGGKKAAPSGGSSETAGGGAASPSASAAPAPGTTPLTSGDLAVFRGTKDLSGASSAALEMADNYLEPTVLTGKPGQKVTLSLSNSGQAIHNLSIKEQNVDQDVQAGQKNVSAVVTFPQSGSVVFFCKYHLSLNMRGELKATP